MYTVEEAKARGIAYVEKYESKYVEKRKEPLTDSFIEEFISFPDNAQRILYPHHVLMTTWGLINSYPYHIEQILKVCNESEKINWVTKHYNCDFWTAMCTKCPL